MPPRRPPRFGSIALALPAVGGAVLFEDLLLAALGLTAAGVGAYVVSTLPDWASSWVVAASATAETAAAADKAAVATLSQAGLALPSSCRWILSPDIAMEQIRQRVQRDVAEQRLGSAATQAIDEAFDAAGLSMSGRAFLTKEVIALLGDRSAHFAVLFVHELLARIGAVAMQLGAVESPLLALIQAAVNELLSGLEKCVGSVRKSWPRLIWAKLQGVIPFVARTLKGLLPRVLKGGSLVTVAAWMGAVLDDIEEQGQDGYDQVTSMDWWLDLLARRAQQAAAAQHLVYGLKTDPLVTLHNELAPTIAIRSGESLPGGAYRVRVDGEELPGLILLPAVLTWDPDAVLVVRGGRSSGEAWASAQWAASGALFRLLRSERGVMALVPPEQAPQELEGLLAASGARPMRTASASASTAPSPRPVGVVSGPAATAPGQATWSSVAMDIDVRLMGADGVEYPPGPVPAGAYDVWASPYGLSAMRLTAEPLVLQAGRAYVFDCDGTRCRLQ